MSFRALAPRESAVDACAQAVRGAILRGEIAPGERLPPERLLAERLGVSRLTLRAGLAKVASTGLLTVKQGSGYRVMDYRRSGGPDLLPGLAELARRRGDLPEIAAELLRVRRHLARAVLERLAEVALPGCDRRVGEAVDAFDRAIAGGAGPDELVHADLAILRALLDETRSPVMALCLNPISAVITGMPALRDAMYAEPHGNAEGWRMLVAWLAERPAAFIDAILVELGRRDRITVRRLTSPRRSSSK